MTFLKRLIHHFWENVQGGSNKYVMVFVELLLSPMLNYFALASALFCTSGAVLAQGGLSKSSTTAKPLGTTGAESTTQPEAAPAVSTPEPGTLSGSYQATGNISLLGKPSPSLGHRLNLSYALQLGSLDARLENYVDGSYNADPPGVLRNNINEPKFEAQLMYNRPLSSGVGFTGGLLYHDNFRFPDRYYWAITGLTGSVPIGQYVTLSGAALVEKKLRGARAFYDLSGTMEYRFAPRWNTQFSFHRYENVGQFDPQPTQKREIEIGLNHALGLRQTVCVSFFRHVQFNVPNDQFSFLKFKYGVSF